MASTTKWAIALRRDGVAAGRRQPGRLARAALCAILLWLPLLPTATATGTGQMKGSLVPAVHLLASDDRMHRLAAEGGYRAVVQVFPWRDIEPTRGEWHWQQPDFAVQAAEYYGLGLIVRLDHPPDWALGSAADGAASPVDLGAYANFAAAVAGRYRGRVQAYVIWNEPNLAREWAGWPPDPAGYAALLCRAHAALKAADPGAALVSAGLAPTNGGDGALDDRAFLRGIYEAGAGRCFDALGAHAYGFGHPPDDPRGAHDGLNLARLADLREIMEAHGDGAKPVWITELGWTTEGAGEHAWQTVSPGQQAEYLTRAWQQIPRAWPFVRVVTIWNISHALPAGDEMTGYSLLDVDGRPKPAYDALRALLAQGFDGRLAERADWLRTAGRQDEPAEIPILAADEVVHLGDNQ